MKRVYSLTSLLIFAWVLLIPSQGIMAITPQKVDSVIVPEDSVVTYIPRQEYLSIKTNVLFYGVYLPGYNRWCPIPNIAVEYYPRKGHFTFGASLDFPWWKDYDNHKFFEVRNYQLETRYYLSHRAHESYGAYGQAGPAYRGFYLQGYVHAGLFEIGFDADRGWKGEGIGAGVGAGYVMPISRKGHWRLEFALQVGWFGCKYDPFQYENPVNPNYRDHLYYYKWTLSSDLFKKRQYRYHWFGPTRIGITLSYDLLYRRVQKRGISFKAYEPYKTYRPYEPNEAHKPYEPYESHYSPERRPAP